MLCSLGLFAQNQTKEEFEKVIKPLNDRILGLEKENIKLKNDIGSLSSKFSTITVKLDSLHRQSDTNSIAINNASAELGLKITTTEANANQKITEVDKSLSKTSLLGIIGVLLAFILSGGLYWLVSNRVKLDKSDIIEKLSNTKSSIEESLVKEFIKQTDLLDSQLHLIEQQQATIQATPNAEPDHSLALKVASQINVIENNLNRMDQETKGIKHIRRSMLTLKDNLLANGYEMPELLNQQFHQGMKVIVTASIADENLEKDSEIISKVLIPQVNFNNKMIQTAQIETSKGY